MTRALPESSHQAEQFRRMKLSFVENGSADHEVLLKMARHKARKKRHSFLPRWRFASLVWGVLAGVFACGSALALAVSTGVIKWSEEETHGAPPLLSELQFKKIGQKNGHDPRLALPTESKVLEPEGPSHSPSPGGGDRLDVPPGGVSSSSSASFRLPTAATPHATPLPETKVALPLVGGPNEAASLSEKQNAAEWARVAASMRQGDEEAATRQLQPLTTSRDPKVRDAALLLQLQLQLERGQASRSQLAQLRQLAVSGASPSVRASARRLLRKMHSSSDSDHK